MADYEETYKKILDLKDSFDQNLAKVTMHTSFNALEKLLTDQNIIITQEQIKQAYNETLKHALNAEEVYKTENKKVPEDITQIFEKSKKIHDALISRIKIKETK